MLLRFQRRLVNEVVWSFCWQCRTPVNGRYDHQWFFFSSNWAEHMATIENSHYSTRPLSWYAGFVEYARKHYRGLYRHYMFLLSSLELYTSAWTEEHFQYANQLLEKYYGVKHGT